MEVKDGLTGVGTRICHDSIPAFIETGLLSDTSRHAEQLTEQVFASRRRRQIGNVAPGNNEDVGRCLRCQIGERHGIRRFRHEFRPEVASDDPTEDTVRIERRCRGHVLVHGSRSHSVGSPSTVVQVETLDDTIRMPELPEVETVRRSLQSVITGRLITRVRGDSFPEVMGPGGLDRSEILLGRRITGIDRRGKYLVIDLDDGSALIVHLRMTGQLVAANQHEPPLRFQHLAIGLVRPTVPGDTDDGEKPEPDGPIELRFADQRKFGRVLHVAASERPHLFRTMGPEPLLAGFTPETLGAALAGRRAPVKNVLLDQRRVAGLGNIYVDEALFRAGVNPVQPAGSLDAAGITALHAAIVAVLNESLDRRGTTFSSFLDGYGRQGENGTNLRVYGRGRSGQPCVVCGTPLQQVRLAGRSSTFCPVCQPLT